MKQKIAKLSERQSFDFDEASDTTERIAENVCVFIFDWVFPKN